MSQPAKTSDLYERSERCAAGSGLGYHSRVRWSSRLGLVFAALATGSVLAMIAPEIRPRDEVSWVEVELTVPRTVPEGRTLVFQVRIRNTHPRKRRAFVNAVDLPSDLFPGAVVRGGVPPGSARHLPISGTDRFQARRELAPGESFTVVFRVEKLARGRYEGEIDVVLDGANWVRHPITVEVGPPGR